MGEKRGHTIKIEYPFNTAGVLEVYYPDLDKWFRTTPSEFRSFDGRRRITEPEYVSRANRDIPMITEEYFGPVYMYGSNQVVEQTNSGMIIGGVKWEEARKISLERAKKSR